MRSSRKPRRSRDAEGHTPEAHVRHGGEDFKASRFSYDLDIVPLPRPAIVRPSYPQVVSMFQLKYGLSAGAVAAAGLLAWSGVNAHAQNRSEIEGAGRVKTVFVIAMENHNWTQPATQTSPLQVFQ